VPADHQQPHPGRRRGSGAAARRRPADRRWSGHPPAELDGPRGSRGRGSRRSGPGTASRCGHARDSGAHSWRRSAAYGLLLAFTTLLTTPIALQNHWQISGLWLILTPFLVLRPFVRDAWRMAVHRSLGTVAGVLLVLLLALRLPQALPLQIPAILAALIAAMVAIRRGHPALMLMALTVAVVLFNSTHADLLQMADERLQASGLGVAITLVVMALAHPIERRLAGALPPQPRAPAP